MASQSLNNSRSAKRGREVYSHLYKSKRWQKLRKEHLARQPYCQCLHHKGQFVRGNVVDHIIPHKGDLHKFWSRGNLQTMTKQCHDKFKQSQERGGRGFNQGCDEQGNPLGDASHWE